MYYCLTHTSPRLFVEGTCWTERSWKGQPRTSDWLPWGQPYQHPTHSRLHPLPPTHPSHDHSGITVHRGTYKGSRDCPKQHNLWPNISQLMLCAWCSCSFRPSVKRSNEGECVPGSRANGGVLSADRGRYITPALPHPTSSLSCSQSHAFSAGHAQV